jgi:hypothetical protein
LEQGLPPERELLLSRAAAAFFVDFFDFDFSAVTELATLGVRRHRQPIYQVV